MLSNNKGFSLIELMVVVAIIAILSTIAIPSYNNFQAKARQKEGFSLLGAYYTAAQASRAEMGAFPGNFLETGFQPSGTLHYRVTAADNAGFVPRYGTRLNAGCVATNGGCTGTPALSTPFVIWQEETVGAYVPAAPAGCVAAATNLAFLACVGGIIKTAAGSDIYSINQLKTLTMVADGLN